MNHTFRVGCRPLLAVAAIALAGCNPSDGDDIYAASSYSFGDALTEFYVSDFTAFEGIAAALREANDRYTVQDFSWSFPGGTEVYDSYSLSNANVEYAHAVGLTGDGQIISVIDEGFLTSHDEFLGKAISTPGGAFDPIVADHGTAVASIAAGVSDNGEMIGVAPLASLQLGSFLSLGSMTAATQQAEALGAIVQNNSWGYGLNVSSSNYDVLFGSGSGATYINALQSLADDTVIVFAHSNDASKNRAEIMAALPRLVNGIEGSWIAAINAVPTFSGDRLVSAQRISSACLEAAAWCLAADGTVHAASSAGNSEYALSTGTSFAAPQISGAVALLAEAFPLLSAQELRARILASANNEFFEHTGYVDFGSGILHGFDEEFGHGFLDVKAALLPIGGSYVRSEDGDVVAAGPQISSGGMVGNVLSTRLANHDIMIVDGMGGGFDTSADLLAAEARYAQAPESAIADLLSQDLATQQASFQNSSPFSKFVSGQELSIADGEFEVAMFIPQAEQNADFGIAMARTFDIENAQLSLGLSALREGDGFVGLKPVADGVNMNSAHAAATADWMVPLQGGLDFRLSASIGVAYPDASVPAMELRPVRYNSVGVKFGKSEIFNRGDRLSFGVALPQAVHSGDVKMVVPVAMASGTTTFDSYDVSLVPDARQLDVSASYSMPMSNTSEFLFSATRSLNEGNIDGQHNTVVAAGFRFQF